MYDVNLRREFDKTNLKAKDLGLYLISQCPNSDVCICGDANNFFIHRDDENKIVSFDTDDLSSEEDYINHDEKPRILTREETYTDIWSKGISSLKEIFNSNED